MPEHRFRLHLTECEYAAIDRLAKEHGRSFNGEVIWALREYIKKGPEKEKIVHIETEINLTNDVNRKSTLVLGTISQHSGSFQAWRVGSGSFASPANDNRLTYRTEPLDHLRSPEHAERHLAMLDIPVDYPYAIAKKAMSNGVWGYEVLFVPTNN